MDTERLKRLAAEGDEEARRDLVREEVRLGLRGVFVRVAGRQLLNGAVVGAMENPWPHLGPLKMHLAAGPRAIPLCDRGVRGGGGLFQRALAVEITDAGESLPVCEECERRARLSVAARARYLERCA